MKDREDTKRQACNYPARCLWVLSGKGSPATPHQAAKCNFVNKRILWNVVPQGLSHTKPLVLKKRMSNNSPHSPGDTGDRPGTLCSTCVHIPRSFKLCSEHSAPSLDYTPPIKSRPPRSPSQPCLGYTRLAEGRKQLQQFAP